MVGRHHLVQIKDIEELALLVFLPSHHAPLPMMIHSIERNHGSPIASMGVLQHNRGYSGHAERDLANIKTESLSRLFRSARTAQRVTGKNGYTLSRAVCVLPCICLGHKAQNGRIVTTCGDQYKT